jgi:hypothetical protein
MAPIMNDKNIARFCYCISPPYSNFTRALNGPSTVRTKPVTNVLSAMLAPSSSSDPLLDDVPALPDCRMQVGATRIMDTRTQPSRARFISHIFACPDVSSPRTAFYCPNPRAGPVYRLCPMRNRAFPSVSLSSSLSPFARAIASLSVLRLCTAAEMVGMGLPRPVFGTETSTGTCTGFKFTCKASGSSRARCTDTNNVANCVLSRRASHLLPLRPPCPPSDRGNSRRRLLLRQRGKKRRVCPRGSEQLAQHARLGRAWPTSVRAVVPHEGCRRGR